MPRQRPGASWRFLAHRRPGSAITLNSTQFEPSEFDELVVGDWLHLEQMDTRDWWMQVGPLTINIHIRADGKHDLIVEDETQPGVLVRYRKGQLVDE
jgi:hypothetical protein